MMGRLVHAGFQLGILVVFICLMVAGNIIVGALGESARPRLAKYYTFGDRTAYGLLLLRLVGIGLVLRSVEIAVLSHLKILGVQLQIDNFGKTHSLNDHSDIFPNFLDEEFDLFKLD